MAIVLLMVVLLMASPLPACAQRNTGVSPAMDNTAVSPSTGNFTKQLALYQDMRKLWSEHVMWTREYVLASLDDRPEAPLVAQRLLKNQEDIGKAIVPYYGQEAGDRMGALMKEHILVAVDLLKAAKSGDQAKFKDAEDRWHKNAADIAGFLSSANPNWKTDEIVNMLNMHLKLTTQEAVAHMNKNYSEDIQLYDQIYDQILGMSDDISAGIIKQFPEKF